MNSVRFVVILSALLPTWAAAQDETIFLVVSGEQVDAAAQTLCASLEEDLQRPVTCTTASADLTSTGTPEPSSRTTLTIEVNTVARLTYRENGVERMREVDLPLDAEGRDEVLRLVAVNLVQDPAAALIASAPTEIETAPETETETTTPRTPTREAPPDVDGDSLAMTHPIQLGASILFGAVSSDDQALYAYWGLGIGYVVHPHIALGVDRLSVNFGYSSIEGTLFSMQLTPYVEAFSFVGERLQLYGQLGVALQARQESIAREGFFQVAPFVGGGARYWFADWFSLGLEIGIHLIATTAFQMGPVTLPQGTLPGSIGLTADFHF